MSEWRFRRMLPGEMNIDPIESEFFSTEALDSMSDALVRESIQNSLDAGLERRKFASDSCSDLSDRAFPRGISPISDPTSARREAV